jgi:chitinase
MLVGVAAYSRGFGNCGGLHLPAYGGSPDTDWDTGSVDYKNLPQPGAVEKWDPEAQATYSYDPQKKIFTSYDSTESVRAKCKFVRKMGLGGILMWECSADHPVTNPRSLIRTVHESLLVKPTKKSLLRKVSTSLFRRKKKDGKS